MSERGPDRKEEQPERDDRHLYGRRAYDHGPPPGIDERRQASDGAPASNGHPTANTRALQKLEPRELQKVDQAPSGQNGAPRPAAGEADHQARPDDQHKQQDAPGEKKHQPHKPHVREGLPRLLFIGLIVALVVAALAAGLLFWRRHHRLAKEASRRSQEIDRGPRVFVTAVRTEPGVRDVTLPADVRGFLQATVYAKVAGYVKSIVVDKGDAVRKGQVLGVLESPEVDQQVAAARADVEVKKRTYERYKHLVAKDFVSRQDFDTARAQYEVAEATLKQARAMQDYETLRAPFAGTVTARYVDPGALVPAATGSTQSALPLVDIADLGRLRILLFVQQDAAPFVHVGDRAEIGVDERPDLKITAPITRLSDALDPRSRTMLCEIWLANEPRLYPGTFVHVTLHLKMSTFPIVPSGALVIHDNKPALAVIRDNKVHFVPVKPGLDDGHDVQIQEGVKAGEKVALNVPAEIADGAAVQPQENQEKKDGADKPGGGQGQKSGGDGKSGQGAQAGGNKSSGDGSDPGDAQQRQKSPADKGSGDQHKDDHATGGK